MKKLFTVFILAVCIGFASCVKDNSNGDSSGGDRTTQRTLFLYLAGNNSLSGDIINNLEAIRGAATREILRNNRILAFCALSNQQPKLVEAVYDNKIGEAVYKELIVYTGENSADIKIYAQAIADMKRIAPAQTYALVLGSHASGWLPAPTSNRSLDSYLVKPKPHHGEENLIRDPFREVSWAQPQTRVFGQDGSQWMNLAELGEATPDGVFDFILMDCCLMGQAEVAYEFRNKADYLIASPAEVLSFGMPYWKIIAPIFADGDQVANLKNVCDEYNSFYKYYNNPSGSTSSWSSYNSATIALYDCSEMDALADVMKQVITKAGNLIPGMNVQDIQVYDRTNNPSSFDIKDVVYNLIAPADPLIALFDNQLAKTVIYKATTGRMINLMITSYSGMSIYLPLSSYSDLNVHYNNTKLYKKIYGIN